MDFERLRENGHPRANEDSSPPPEPTTGAQQRYVDRIRLFAEDGRGMPRLRHHAFWMLHNCVAHPLLAIGRPRRSTVTTEFHEITSHWLNHESMTAFGTQLDSLRASLKQADEDMEDAVECADRAARSLRRWKTGGALDAVEMAARWGRTARRLVHQALTISGAPPRRRAP